MIRSAAVDWVRAVAERLGAMREEMVFLGGATVGLLITDPAAAAVRPTRDVDVIVEIGSMAEYVALRDRLAEKGFAEDTEEGAPICRWTVEGITVDVMPTTIDILGFTNRWYASAMRTARRVPLTETISIRVVTAPYFVATKLEAFSGRGKEDYLASHDLEDVIAVVDGRPELPREVADSDAALKEHLRDWLGSLLDTIAFIDALPGHLPGDAASQRRLPIVVERLETIAGRRTVSR